MAWDLGKARRGTSPLLFVVFFLFWTVLGLLRQVGMVFCAGCAFGLPTVQGILEI